MSKIHAIMLFWGLFCGAALPAQAPNRPVPAGVPSYAFTRYSNADYGYYMTSPFRLGAAGFTPQPVMILDADGYLVWYARLAARNVVDFKYFPESGQYGYMQFQNPRNARYILLNQDFQLLDSFATVNGILPDVHDFETTAHQTYFLAGAHDTIMDLSAYIYNGKPGSDTTHVTGFVVQELDEDHNLLFQWNSSEHIPPGQAYAFYGYNAGAYDYCHGNTIEEDTDGNLLLSFRHLNAVYKVDRLTGKTIWQLGGKTSSFTFANDPGFSGQHDARRLPNGHIAVLDNGNMALPVPNSRAVEYRLDTLNWVATKVWEYRPQPLLFAPSMGNHQTTAGRQHLVNYGYVFRPNPTFVLTDDAGNLLSALFFRDSFMSYRSFIFDLPFPTQARPTINCAQQGGLATLSAPPGHERYAWSTGATGSSITVQATGTYQVWINYGTGMLGSEPYVVQDVNNVCSLSATNETPAVENTAIIGYFDLSGRAIPPPQPTGSRICVVRYADGRMGLKLY